ncbi:MAG: CHASE3 domain-containing protein [Verrucomicrobiae bacterium]|nr:CHASE3 domain-containing protein [Verrucomicrobiae bacterium]
MRISVVRKISLGFGLLLVVLALLSVVAVVNGRALVQNSGAVIHSHLVLSGLSEISDMTRDVQSGYRGFVITGQEEFLEHYFVADAAILPRIAELGQTVAGDHAQGGRLDALRADVEMLLGHGRELIETRRRDGREKALALVERGRGKEIMERIRDGISEMNAAEGATLDASRAESMALLRGTMTTAVLCGIVGVLAVGAAIIVLRADVRERERLERALVAAGDREQRKIGQDLHDGLCQQLAGIAYLAQALEASLAGVSAEGAQTARRISQLIGAANLQARDVSHGLHPVELAEDGLMSALRQLAASTERTFGVPCVFECPRQILVSDNEAAIHLYRIAREAIHNAVRHAAPGRIVVRLVAKGDEALLEIRDDGRGIAGNAEKGRGIGLKTMRFRANSLGGDLSVSSRHGKGTSVTCRFPASVTAVDEWDDETLAGATPSAVVGGAGSKSAQGAT